MSDQKRDEAFMAKCIELARFGKGRVSPNPLVGALIVKRGRILGRGFHRRFGGPHAEINAMRNAGDELKGATLYVNLEPCIHSGKTPPCTDAIIPQGIRRVVVGMTDPNPLVRRKGIRALKSAGIEVDVGILEAACKKLNEFFLKRVTTGLPFVALKVAQTLDGKISLPGGPARWITSRDSRKYVHRLRAEYDAVLVGARTAILDNPRLTVRFVKGRNPKRVLLDGNLRSPLSSRLFTDPLRSQTIVVTQGNGSSEICRKKKILELRGVTVVEIEADRKGRIDLRMVLKQLASAGINSLLVEGGQEVFTQFLREGLADKAYFFVAPKIYGCNGLPAFGELSPWVRSLKASSIHLESVGSDTLIEAYF